MFAISHGLQCSFQRVDLPYLFGSRGC